MYGPIIKGSMCRLRPPRLEDAARIVSWWEDLEVTARLMSPFPRSIEEQEAWIRDRATDESEILWMVEYQGRVVGLTGVHQIDWRNLHGRGGTVIGDKTVWGHGIARELMQLRATFVFRQTPLRKLKSGYIQGNDASWRAQSAAGYREVGRHHEEVFRDGVWLDYILTELRRSDWAAASA